MKPTPEQLAGMATRIMAVMPRTRGRALDTGAGEIAILIGDLCNDTESAERLAEQLVRHPWRRWNFPEFSAVANRLAAAARQVAEFTEPKLKSQLVPDLFSDAEYEALYTRAVKAGLKFCGLDIPDVLEAEAAARREAAAFFDTCPQSMREQLMEECRAEFIARMATYGHQNSRATEPEFLDKNARHFAEGRIYRYLVMSDRLFKPLPAGPSETLGQNTLSKLAQHKRL